MNLLDQFVIFFLWFGFVFFGVRLFLNGIKHYQTNKNEYKRKKEGETFKNGFCILDGKK